MCGIAGFIQKAPNPEALPRMLGRIKHRGPDGEGAWERQMGGWQVAIGHRRLSIIDVEGGVQPMENAGGDVVISYNGEIYNFMRLRQSLEGKGHRFRTRSDTEVILEHFQENGAGGIDALDGMFAFAVWEARERRLTLARDRTGIKPLYYAELPDGGIVFASELSALLAHGGVDRELSIEGLASYFFSDYVHPPATIVRKVRKLPPGHTIIWQDGAFGLPHAFWQMPPPRPAPDKPDTALAADLWSDISQVVKDQLVSDVPVGIFLSGGIDSSCVATAAVAAGGRMKAFSIGFDDATFDESAYARMMAEKLNVEWITETLHERNLIDVMDVALDFIDEPMADPSFLPTFLLSRLAARHVKVVVGGDGGDELWGGYPTYRGHRFASMYQYVPGWIRKHVVGGVVGRLPINDRYQSLEWKLRRFTKRWDDDVVTRHLRWMSSVDLPDLAQAIPAAKDMMPATLATQLPETDDWLQRIMALDFATYMPGSVLTKVDRASMAHGLEVRPPLLGDTLVDRSFALPSRYKLRRGTGKYLLKMALRGKIPDEIIDRPKKGFGIPLASWLRGPLKDRIHQVVTDSPVYGRGILDGAVFRRWNDEHQQKRADHSKPLWAMLVLDHWFRRH
jgi:asparagine synthase (glutamine-hydrolysing)